jgi:hypothetical protein
MLHIVITIIVNRHGVVHNVVDFSVPFVVKSGSADDCGKT